MRNGISIPVSLNGIIKAEIAFHPPAGRINQILYDHVGSRYQFDTNGEERTRAPLQPDLSVPVGPIVPLADISACQMMPSCFGLFLSWRLLE